MSRRSKWMLEDRQRLAERAAEWLDVLNQAKEGERAELAEWLAASPKHAEELLFVTAMSEELKRSNLRQLPFVKKRMSELEENVVPLLERPRMRKPASTHRLRVWGLAAAAVLAVVGMLSWQEYRRTAYETGIGEQRTIRLEDGSTIELNTQSQVRLLYSDKAREIRLVRGEALFAVHKDAMRPFRVVTDDAVVVALGTQFNVDRHHGATIVSVVEGRVSVAPAASREDAKAELGAGEEAHVARGREVMKRADAPQVARAVAWRDRQLVFLSDTLVDIAAEFNRYNGTPRLVVEDPTAGSKRYSGVFASGDPASLIEFLKEDSQLRLQEKGHEIHVASRARAR